MGSVSPVMTEECPGSITTTFPFVVCAGSSGCSCTSSTSSPSVCISSFISACISSTSCSFSSFCCSSCCSALCVSTTFFSSDEAFVQLVSKNIIPKQKINIFFVILFYLYKTICLCNFFRQTDYFLPGCIDITPCIAVFFRATFSFHSYGN